MRLLERLGNDIACWKIVVLAMEFPVVTGEHGNDGAHRFLPPIALVAHADAERVQLSRAGAFTHAEIDPSAGQQIERGNALCDTVWLIGRKLDDAMAKPDILRALRRGGEEDLRR